MYARIICPDLGPAEPRLTDPPMSKRTWLLERLVLGASEASPLGASGIPPYTSFFTCPSISNSSSRSCPVHSVSVPLLWLPSGQDGLGHCCTTP